MNVKWALSRLGLALALAALVVMGFNLLVIRIGGPELQESAAQLAPVDVALVLGASPWSPDGSESEHFAGRMQAAAELYHSGRARHLLVSGANPAPNYNEPLKMRNALIALGVPDSAITQDFAGRRTLDSVIRAREIFGHIDGKRNVAAGGCVHRF